MKDKKIFKKWWFWVIAVLLILGIIGSLGRTNDNGTAQMSGTKQSDTSEAALPKLKLDDYKGKEGLVVYKDLKGKGYKVDAIFEKQALTDINGSASDVFEPLDPNKPDDRLSVDSFIIADLSQNGDSVKMTIIKQSAN